MKQAYARGLKSGCAVPLLCHDKIVGSMMLASLRESAFTEDDQTCLPRSAPKSRLRLTTLSITSACAVPSAKWCGSGTGRNCYWRLTMRSFRISIEGVGEINLASLRGSFLTMERSLRCSSPRARDCGYRHWTRARSSKPRLRKAFRFRRRAPRRRGAVVGTRSAGGPADRPPAISQSLGAECGREGNPVRMCSPVDRAWASLRRAECSEPEGSGIYKRACHAARDSVPAKLRSR